jgi:hypothetical protein
VSLNAGKVSIRMNGERGLFYGFVSDLIWNLKYESIGGRNIYMSGEECNGRRLI